MGKKNNRKKRREHLTKEYIARIQYKHQGSVVIEKIPNDTETLDVLNDSIELQNEDESQGSFKETIIKLPDSMTEDIPSHNTTYHSKIKPFMNKHGDGIKKKVNPVSNKIKSIFKPIGDKINKACKPVIDRVNSFLLPAKKQCIKIWRSKTVRIVRRYVKKGWNELKEYMSKVYDFLMYKPFRSSLILAFFSLIFIEAMSRRSLGEAIVFMAQKPVIFIFNYLIVLAPFLMVMAVRRKIAVYIFFTVLWMLVGVTDFMLLTHRTTPFTGVDLKIDRNEITVIFNYLDEVQSVLLILAIIITIITLILVMIFSKKTECRFGRVKSTVLVAVLWVVIYYSVIFGINSGILSTKFGNLGISYHDYGMPYCFIVTIVDTGIAKPEDYSEEKMDNLVSVDETASPEVEVKESKSIDELPNIIFIQLESFIDPLLIKNGVEYSEDPMPFYRSLREKYSSGYLTVPTVVAGTCNTEFEVITGMSLGFFGPGEYPYKTILKETTCESMAFDLKALGYKTHAIHNHTSGFYGRNLIYSHFGFDTFTGVEMMHDTSKTANRSWVKDDVLTGCIIDALTSSEEKDLVYTISVQCHGTYNSDLPEEEQLIEVTGIDDAELLQAYNYYINQVKQVDNVIKDLIYNLSILEEDVVLVMYGDHIPGLSLGDEMFEDKTIYETEYVIWDNMGLEKQDMNMTSFQIAAEVFERLGIYEGTVFKYHQEADKEAEDYMPGLEYLQYDMLYGQNYVYGGENPYEATDIRYGVKDIVIDKAFYDGEYLYVSAVDKCFSKYSKLFIDGNRMSDGDTEVIFSDLLKVRVTPEKIVDGAVLTIHQINSLDVEFHCSPEYIFSAEENITIPDDVIVDETITEEVTEDGNQTGTDMDVTDEMITEENTETN